MNGRKRTIIEVNGDPFELILTIRAIKEISLHFGSLENLVEKANKENFELSIDDIVWLITLLSNQSVSIYNLNHIETPKALLSEEIVELIASPTELKNYIDAISEVMKNAQGINIKNNN